jgi:hypothetical protein
LGLARKNGTTHPLLTAFLVAKHINLAAGGAVLAPWETGELPEEWLDAAETLISDLPSMRKGFQQVEDRLAKWRAEHRRKNG